MNIESVRRTAAVATVMLCMAACSSFASGGCKRDDPKNLATVPDSFLVTFETSRGPVDVMARKAWSPLGVARLYALLQERHFDDVRFFRVIKNYVAQFGLSGDPKVNDAWRDRCISDEPVKHLNTRGAISYARGDSNTRGVQLFINLKDNPKLDTLGGFGFPPIAEVVRGMEAVDSLYNGYGESAPKSGSQYGREGPSQDSIGKKGSVYLNGGWPKLDYVKTARIVKEWKS
jgi:cyclophilin family peptidyl-prolyl cis-trans isomerase